ncbi:MAG: hypothetical protein ABIK98_09470 [Pseudomonadota bacterium]|uniref:Uncharacterized protein n=1 Tax=Candidatus Desulfatibia profunda TaxID=2841695 RepID=A0A8J6NX75_9BACT|nr:hypothetical protein [Candidatus Desulfatibia profunda]MBL7180392.1 hypothetical protein [Desulfobacterales bacterium]
MQPHSNPLCVQGKKNVFCPYYGECLDYACKKGWEYWACLDCEHKRTSEPVTASLVPTQDCDSYYSLSPSLFIKSREVVSELL